ncbi:hypothetical protein ACFQJC_14445 [Haloferax namakaokahaiae]|uniref:Uncharacterized protein n=1 Tax=Haloferax namakaokahaiae TaxID=1748331 RepID=A0ABD5ZI66_9EURY
MRFPVEHVPDGHIFAPHHLYIGVLLAAVALAAVWDNNRRAEPVGGAVAVGVSTFGFALTWRYYPVTGATLALGGLLGALSAFPLERDVWADARTRYAVLFILGVLVALDDVVSHSFGVWTPLDALWKAHLIQFVA